MRRTRLALFVALAAAPLVTTTPARAAWPNDPAVNVRIAPSSANQAAFFTAEDGQGGAFVVWTESSDIRAQHLTAQGLVAPGWPASGVVVCGAANYQYATAMVADGSGGFIVAWDDNRADVSGDVYAQRVNAAGQVLWAADGVALSTASGEQNSSALCADGTGGAVFAWQDGHDFDTNSYDIYAQRVSAAGATMWAANGIVVNAYFGPQTQVSVVSDGTPGGAYLAWSDTRLSGQQISVVRLSASGTRRSEWADGGVAACNTGTPFDPVIIGDGAFGILVAWRDNRSGTYNIHAVRLLPDATVAPGWGAQGNEVSNDTFLDFEPHLTADGAGGAIVMWYDYRFGSGDYFAQRIGANGQLAWTANGVAVATAPGTQYGARMVSDGAGGAVIAWMDTRALADPMVYAQRIDAAGTRAPGFAAGGNAVATAHWAQMLDVCSDAAGGAVLVWQNNSSPQAGYAQRIDRWGYLGAQPSIASVKDVPHDQGGVVKLSWRPSPLDAWPANAITSYGVYRSVPTLAAEADLASGRAALLREGGAAPASTRAGVRALLEHAVAGAIVYWEYVGGVTPAQLAGYSMLAPTAQDSVPGSNPRTLFMVRAGDAANRFWYSDADSGYSTDDLAPAAPAPFTGTYAGGATNLHWARNTEADLAGYRLYRGASAGFVPSPANLVASPPDTGYADPGAAGATYKLTAIDAHGNESAPSLLTPAGTLAVGEPVALTLALSAATPNPSRGAATCHFTLPAAGTARLALYDAAGRLVRVLADGPHAAGEHAVRWDGTGEDGARLPAGLYLARLTFGGRTLTGKVARIE